MHGPLFTLRMEQTLGDIPDELLLSQESTAIFDACPSPAPSIADSFLDYTRHSDEVTPDEDSMETEEREPSDSDAKGQASTGRQTTTAQDGRPQPKSVAPRKDRALAGVKELLHPRGYDVASVLPMPRAANAANDSLAERCKVANTDTHMQVVRGFCNAGRVEAALDAPRTRAHQTLKV